MAKIEEGEQLMLMDIHTPEAKKVLAKSIEYDKVKKKRIQHLADEVVKKRELSVLVHALDYKPDGDGVINFGVGEYEIKITPGEVKETISVTKRKTEE